MIDLKDAVKFAEEQENKPVTMFIYSYYDKKMDMFNTPSFSIEDPSFMFNACKAAVIKGKIGKAEAEDLVFVQLGTIDLKTGHFEIFKEPLIILECSTALPVVKGETV